TNREWSSILELLSLLASSGRDLRATGVRVRPRRLLPSSFRLLSIAPRPSARNWRGSSRTREPRPRVLKILPAAAALYRAQIAKGLDGDPREVNKARVVLRETFGRVNMRRDGKMLYAEYALNPRRCCKLLV